MVLDGGPSPKRRRTCDASLSAEQIAQSNATLHAFTGQRQNRWMQGTLGAPGANGEGGSTSEQTEAVRDPQYIRKPRQRHDSMSRESNDDVGRLLDIANAAITSKAAEAFSRESQSPVADLPQNRRPTASEGANLVQYETPDIAGTTRLSTSSATMATGSRPGAQPGLPSPAPSEDPTNSPTSRDMFAQEMNAAVTGQPLFRTPSSPKDKQPTPRINAIVTNHGNVSPAQQSPMSLPRQRPRDSPQVPAVQVPSQYMLRTQQSSPFFAVPQQRPWNGSDVSNASLAAHQRQLSNQMQRQAQPMSPAQPPNPFDLGSMRVRIERYMQTEASGYGDTDKARLEILRDATMKGDWFYIVLSQVYCIRTDAPTQLPQPLTHLDKASWETLDTLLCSNRALNPSLVRWFANFPVPIMTIYTSATRDAYEKQVQQVIEFLSRLPRVWPLLLEKSKSRLAPPLCQDLAEVLNLASVVLQATTFRAIARLVWATDSSPGLSALETLHLMDQTGFMGQMWQRTPKERDQAREAYARVYALWRSHLHRAERQEGFQLPHDLVSIFQNHPPSMATNVQFMQTQLQQQQAIAHNQRLMQAQQFHHGRMPSGSRTPSVPTPALAQQPPGPPTPRLMKNRVYPHENEQPRAQPTQPETSKVALHQAHLRSPTLLPSKAVSSGEPLYRYVIGYRLPQTLLKKDLPVQTITFNMSSNDITAMPATDKPVVAGQRPARTVSVQSKLYRLKCAAYPVGGFQTESAWVTADNGWPENVFFSLNGHSLETRRKLHHGRYLPIDVTSYLKAGANTLTVNVNRSSIDRRTLKYVVAVEMIGVIKHTTIVDMLPIISADESLAAIRKSLGGEEAPDDDVMLTSSTLTVKLFDPYSGCRIFDTPVRGASCLHKDCFDLQTFLGQCKREKPGCPTVVDCWRCPLCKGDVRPQTLVIDGWLVEVRKELEKRGRLDTRAIVVEADGSWKPREEERTGVRSPSLERDEQAASVAAAAARRKVVEVIELD